VPYCFVARGKIIFQELLQIHCNYFLAVGALSKEKNERFGYFL